MEREETNVLEQFIPKTSRTDRRPFGIRCKSDSLALSRERGRKVESPARPLDVNTAGAASTSAPEVAEGCYCAVTPIPTPAYDIPPPRTRLNSALPLLVSRPPRSRTRRKYLKIVITPRGITLREYGRYYYTRKLNNLKAPRNSRRRRKRWLNGSRSHARIIFHKYFPDAKVYTIEQINIMEE